MKLWRHDAHGRLSSVLDSRDALPRSLSDVTPFNATWNTLGPGGRSDAHCHDETEIWVIVLGTGRVHCDDESTDVRQGDVILFRPFERHQIENVGAGDTCFLSLYWRDLAAASTEAVGRRGPFSPVEGGGVVVLSAFPTPNGDLHLGHIAGPYLGADIYTRYARMCGADVRHICGTDDFQDYVVKAAHEAGSEIDAMVQQHGAAIGASLRAMLIEPDRFVTPTRDLGYRKMVAERFLTCQANGALRPCVTRALFDESRQRFLTESEISGPCPHCGQPAGAGVCEECGMPNDGVELLEPTNRAADGAVTIRSCTQPVLSEALVREAIADALSKPNLSARLRDLLGAVRATELRPIAATRPGKWGLPVPHEDHDDAVIASWFELAVAQSSAVAEMTHAVDQRRRERPFGRVVYFFGLDNAFYFTVLLPAVAKATLGVDHDRTDYVCNEFYLLDGSKFSTSRRHVVSVQDVLATFSVDEVRFHLCLTRPEDRQTNFALDDLQSTVDTILAGEWQSWLLDLNARVARYFDGRAPDAGVWSQDHREFLARLVERLSQVSASYSAASFSPRRAAEGLVELVRDARRFSQEQRFDVSAVGARTAEHRTAIALELSAAGLLALIAAPILPNFSNELWSGLGGRGRLQAESWPETPPRLAPGTLISIPELFGKGGKQSRPPAFSGQATRRAREAS